ncbi:MAG: hypothetical protein JRI61_08910 [Deltaproteobacteria bacterium]|nr:hypothetical protein [Deltaproteobacteria bacterium]
MIRYFQFFNICLTIIAVIIAYGSGSLLKAAFCVALLGVLWIVGIYKNWKWCGNLMFLIIIGTCTVGLFLNLSFVWILLGVTGALSAYDVNRFEQRKSMAGTIKSIHDMEKAHLIRLMTVIVFSLILGTITQFINIRIEFGMVLSLGILTVFCMNRGTSFLIHKND